VVFIDWYDQQGLQHAVDGGVAVGAGERFGENDRGDYRAIVRKLGEMPWVT